MIDVFWPIATSDWALGLDLVVLIATLVIGHVPLADRIPAIAPYIVAARFAAYLALAIMMLCVGHRLADESAALKSLRQELSAKTIDLTAANDAATKASAARAELAAQAIQDEQRIADYAEALKARPNAACILVPDDFAGRMRH